MGNHYLVPFKCWCVVEVAAAGNFLDADIARTGTFTQYFLSDVPQVKRGILTSAMVYCDSTNNTTYDLIISEGPQANDQRSQVNFIFDSQEFLGADIADATLETFDNIGHAFVLETSNQFYLTLDHSAAPGTCLGRLGFWGVAYF